jgi:MFS family permease
VYTSVREIPPSVSEESSRATTRVGGTVLALGWVSLLTDVSSEMVTAVLPVYLTIVVGLSPLGFGVLDGLYQAGSVLVRLIGGHAADRLGRPKATAQVGYAVSGLCKIGLLTVTTPTGIGAVLAADRAGKGLRTAPRDAMIAASVAPAALGRAFGVHRAMDTAGALAGPLLAFALLLLLPHDYDAVFLISAAFAAIGCAVLWAFVRESAVRARPAARVPLLRVLGDRRMRRLTAVSLLLGLLTVSDGFLYLLLRDLGAVDTAVFPLLFVGTAAVYLTLAVPLGRLADRIGRVPVLLGGHVALLLTYALLVTTPLPVGWALTVTVLAGLGTYYAATDGVLAAIASALTPAASRGTGIALLQTAIAAGRLFAAVLFGLLWTVWDRDTAMLAFAAGLAVGVVGAWRLLRDVDTHTDREDDHA